MTLDQIGMAFDSIHLGQYKNTIVECIDTYTINLTAYHNENKGEFGERVNGISKRLEMKFIVVNTRVNYQLIPFSAEIEFVNGGIE